MQLRKYKAPTMKQALDKVRRDLGDDAVIFSSRTLNSNNGPTRAYNFDKVEVTAAIERKQKLTTKQVDSPAYDFSNSDTKTVLTDDISKGKDGFAKFLINQYGDNNNKQEESDIFSSPFLPAFNSLIKTGFNQQLASYLIAENINACKNIPPGKRNEYILTQIVNKVPVDGHIKINNNSKPKIVALIGPTGVGKTTTLAKIAAHFSIKEKLSVKILTIDTFRIAAAEQLKIYGKILGLTVNVTRESELEKEIDKNRDADLILIDTPGRNYVRAEEVDRVNTWIEKNSEIETHLLISASTSKEALFSIIQSFNRTRIDRLLITKVDETLKFGHLYNIILTSAVPISYLTTGQNVPEDITPATLASVANMFFSGKYN